MTCVKGLTPYLDITTMKVIMSRITTMITIAIVIMTIMIVTMIMIIMK